MKLNNLHVPMMDEKLYWVWGRPVLPLGELEGLREEKPNIISGYED